MARIPAALREDCPNTVVGWFVRERIPWSHDVSTTILEARAKGSRSVTDVAAETDAALVERARQDDGAAFGVLVERYSSRIYALVGSMLRDRAEIEDVVQDVFFKVYRKLPGFEGKSSFYTWLYRVALNTAADHLKRKRNDRTKAIEDFAGLDVEAPGHTPGTDIAAGELRTQVAEAIATLPRKYRDILVLREYEERSYEEISSILGCSKGTVESRLFRARARLKERLKAFI